MLTLEHDNNALVVEKVPTHVRAIISALTEGSTVVLPKTRATWDETVPLNLLHLGLLLADPDPAKLAHSSLAGIPTDPGLIQVTLLVKMLRGARMLERRLNDRQATARECLDAMLCISAPHSTRLEYLALESADVVSYLGSALSLFARAEWFPQKEVVTRRLCLPTQRAAAMPEYIATMQQAEVNRARRPALQVHAGAR